MQKILWETHSQPEPYRQGKDLLLLPRIELNYDPSAIQIVAQVSKETALAWLPQSYYILQKFSKSLEQQN
jgi:hypothetical protein